MKCFIDRKAVAHIRKKKKKEKDGANQIAFKKKKTEGNVKPDLEEYSELVQ